MCGSMPPAAFVAHDGFVDVEHDRFSGAWTVHHRLTKERFALPVPADEWVVEFGQDGTGIIVDGDDEGSVIYCEDCFEWQVYASDGDKVFLVREAETTETVALEDLLVPHDLRRTTLLIGASRAEVVLQIAIFSRPRCVCRVFWDLFDVYRGAGFDCRQGAPSRWVQRGLATWAKVFEEVGAPAELLRSKPVHGNSEEFSQGRVLQFPSVDTCGLLTLLCFWSACSPQRHGLRTARGRDSARLMLSACLQGLSNWAGWEMQLVVGGGVEFRWPSLPKFIGGALVRLQASRELEVSTLPLQGALATLARRGEVDLSALLGEGHVSLCDFLCGLAASRCCATLFGQVVWQVAGRLEAAYGLATRRDIPHIRLDKTGADFASASICIVEPDIVRICGGFEAGRPAGQHSLHRGRCLEGVWAEGVLGSVCGACERRLLDAAAGCPGPELREKLVDWLAGRRVRRMFVTDFRSFVCPY